MSDSIYLCVMSDDFGMHPAVNDGIVQAFSDGLLTDANAAACALATTPRGSLLGRGYLRRIDAADRRWLLQGAEADGDV